MPSTRDIGRNSEVQQVTMVKLNRIIGDFLSIECSDHVELGVNLEGAIFKTGSQKESTQRPTVLKHDKDEPLLHVLVEDNSTRCSRDKVAMVNELEGKLIGILISKRPKILDTAKSISFK